MEYYYPSPATEKPLTEVPAGSLVLGDWREAFRWALCGASTEEESPTFTAESLSLLYVIDTTILPAREPAVGRRITERDRTYFWLKLYKPVPVQKVITIDADVWVLAATRARLSGVRHETIDEILRTLTKEEPVLVSDLDGEIKIRPPISETESLTVRFMREGRKKSKK